MDRRSAVRAVKKTFFLPPPTHTNSRRFKIPPGPHWRDAPLLPKPNREEEKDGFTSFTSSPSYLWEFASRWDFVSSLNPPRIGFAFPFDIIWSAFFGARYYLGNQQKQQRKRLPVFPRFAKSKQALPPMANWRRRRCRKLFSIPPSLFASVASQLAVYPQLQEVQHLLII